MRSLKFRITLKVGSWVSSLFNINLFIKKPDERLVNELRVEFKNLSVFTDLEPEDTVKSNPLDTWLENLN